MSAHGKRKLSASGLSKLESEVPGGVIAPGDDRYGSARRVWNGMIDRYPGAIVRCDSAEQVAAVLAVAREEGLDLAVRGGGHNVAGYGTCDGGVVIDLAPMNSVAFDAEMMRVTAGGGARLGDLDSVTAGHGAVVPAGVVTDTGVAGLALGGGLGWVRNRFGLTCDSLVGVEMVTAAGEIVTATRESHPELLWGLRGGGGNFGVVTALEFQAHPMVPDVWFSLTWYRGDDFEGAVTYYRDFCEAAPDEVSGIGFFATVPPVDDFPADSHGQPAFVMAAVYAGDPVEGERATAPLREYAEPVADFSGGTPFVDVQTLFDEDYPTGLRYYWKSVNLRALDAGAIGVVAQHAPRQPSKISTTDMWHLGGAVTRVAEEDSAFAGRGSAWVVNAEANWESEADDEANIEWARALVDALKPYSDGAQYLNFPGFLEGGEDVMKRSFGSKYGRLRELKRVWDPDNLFHLNQNVRP